MSSWRKKSALVLASMLFVGLCLAPAGTAEAKQRHRIEFQKMPATPGDFANWVGIAKLDGTADLTVISVVPVDTPIGNGVTSYVDTSFTFTPVGNPSQSFTMRFVGIRNNRTGRVVLNGKVTASNYRLVPVEARTHMDAKAIFSVPMIIGSIYYTGP